MAEDAKAAKNRRLAEALRANLKRRKAAARASSAEGTGNGGVAPQKRTDATAHDGGTD